MGQGAESCGAYEVDYDPYDMDGMNDGLWTQRDGSTIHVSKMTKRHLSNSLRLVESLAECATFSDESEKWQQWAEIFERQLERIGDESRTAVYVTPEAVKPTRGAKTIMVCHCGTEYPARTADLKRGWGLSCSKRCASIRRDFGRPAAKPKETQE